MKNRSCSFLRFFLQSLDCFPFVEESGSSYQFLPLWKTEAVLFSHERKMASLLNMKSEKLLCLQMHCNSCILQINTRPVAISLCCMSLRLLTPVVLVFLTFCGAYIVRSGSYLLTASLRSRSSHGRWPESLLSSVVCWIDSSFVLLQLKASFGRAFNSSNFFDAFRVYLEHRNIKTEESKET